MDEFKLIDLGNGNFAKVDAEDFGFLNRFTWQLSDSGYAVTGISCGSDIRRKAFMHRLILANFDGEIHSDHINRDRLDNRRCNLRYATATQNAANRGKLFEKFGSVEFKGVYQNRNAATCSARIIVGGKKIYLGSSHSREDAARLYDAAARIAFGEYAALNFPDEPCDQSVTSKAQATLERYGIRAGKSD